MTKCDEFNYRGKYGPLMAQGRVEYVLENICKFILHGLEMVEKGKEDHYTHTLPQLKSPEESTRSEKKSTK